MSESWVERQIREAQERGAFDNLPGAGKPIEGLDRPYDENWWVKSMMKRENLSFPLPTSLALRKEAEDLLETVSSERSEANVREIVVDLNRRILDARRRPVPGPPVVVRTLDVDDVVARWRSRRG